MDEYDDFIIGPQCEELSIYVGYNIMDEDACEIDWCVDCCDDDDDDDHDDDHDGDHDAPNPQSPPPNPENGSGVRV